MYWKAHTKKCAMSDKIIRFPQTVYPKLTFQHICCLYIVLHSTHAWLQQHERCEKRETRRNMGHAEIMRAILSRCSLPSFPAARTSLAKMEIWRLYLCGRFLFPGSNFGGSLMKDHLTLTDNSIFWAPICLHTDEENHYFLGIFTSVNRISLINGSSANYPFE